MKYLRENGIEDIFCLGDIVGYGPNPNECIDIVRDKCKVSLMGNHDHAVIGLTSTEYFNDYAKMSTTWTSNNLTAENRHFLLSLPFTYQTDQFHMVHASPSLPELWQYVLSEKDAQRELNAFEQKVCFIGHSHFPVVFNKKGYSREEKQKLERFNKYIVNVGSVGQPRDGNPLSCFVLYDTDNDEISYVRVEYEMERTREKIIKAGLPHFLADRLTKGY